MSGNGNARLLRIYCIVLYFLFLISWAFLIHRDYCLTVCQRNLEKTSRLIDIWGQLTPIPKFLTIVIVYITVHAAVAGILAFLRMRNPQSTKD